MLCLMYKFMCGEMIFKLGASLNEGRSRPRITFLIPYFFLAIGDAAIIKPELKEEFGWRDITTNSAFIGFKPSLIASQR